MMRSPYAPHWIERLWLVLLPLVLIGAVVVAVVLLWQASQCEGAFVRTLFWYECIPTVPLPPQEG